MGFFEAVSCQSTLSGFFLSFTTGSDDRLIWQVMGGEVADTSLLARCQGNFCGRRVTAFSMDLPDAGQHGAKHPHGKVPGRGGVGGQLPPKKGQGMPSPGGHFGVCGPECLSPLPFWGRRLGPQPHASHGAFERSRVLRGSAESPPRPSPG